MDGAARLHLVGPEFRGRRRGHRVRRQRLLNQPGFKTQVRVADAQGHRHVQGVAAVDGLPIDACRRLALQVRDEHAQVSAGREVGRRL